MFGVGGLALRWDFCISYFGVISGHQLWLLYLGYGFVGVNWTRAPDEDISLGLVYDCIKWFPDRPGLATGMAIMGFGGGAIIGAPLSIKLMAFFKTAGDAGGGEDVPDDGDDFILSSWMFGVFTIRVPRDGWKPEGCDRAG